MAPWNAYTSEGNHPPECGLLIVYLISTDDAETLYAPLPEVRSWIEKHPEFNRAFLPYLGKQIRSLEEPAADLALHDTITRLSRLILRYTDYSIIPPKPKVD